MLWKSFHTFISLIISIYKTLAKKNVYFLWILNNMKKIYLIMLLNMEKVVEIKTCRKCNSNFGITDKDLEFYNKVSPIFDWKKYQIPTPTLCPNCRQQRRLSFRNERNLYKRDCEATGKNIISMYSLDKNLKIYSQEEWWSDNWNALDYWIDFDFSKTFFEQFSLLLKQVPLVNLWVVNHENSLYNNNCYSLKNCYMSFNTDYWDDNYYSYVWEYCSNIFDCSHIYKSVNCYSCIDLENSSNCFFCSLVKDSSYCYYSSDLINCKYCYGSHWLRNSSYNWFWKQKTEKEWKKLFEKESKSYLSEKNIFYSNQEYVKVPKKNLNIFNSEYCLWEYIKNSKKVYNSFDINDANNCKYIYYSPFETRDVYDSTAIWWINLWYECNEWWINISKCCFIKNPVDGLYKSFYCVLCWKWSSNLFGCIWLRNKQYCILNKQYTKEKYEKLVSKIIEYMQKTWEWWEFFPSSISPFWYNETVAQEYFSLTKKEAKDKWFNWSDYEPPKPNVEKIIPAEKLPEDIKDIPDDILNWAIKCEVTEKPFRIIKQELDFYRKHNLPIPKRHPDQRHLERMQLRSPRKLFDRKCDKCWVEMKTTYSPNRKEIVYCEKCYEKEVY